MNTLNQLKRISFKNSIVLENYFFMTVLQVLNSAFGILLYPYLIRVLGASSYGLYVYALTVTNFFTSFISFGFNFPAVKTVSTNRENLGIKNEQISNVFTAKCYLFLLSAIIFTSLVFSIKAMSNNWLIYTICFTQVFGEILIPSWFFQGIQKMRVLTTIQISTRLLSLPFIFIFIKKAEDMWVYATISSCIMIAIGIVSVIHLKRKENITYRFVAFSSLKKQFKDALPFFWSSAIGTLKEETATLVIGVFFGMRDVAIYDLAKKVVSIPRILTYSINNALFPQIIDKLEKNLVKKIIRYETWIGLSISAAIALCGYWLIYILGGADMLDAYPLAIILSLTILVWLVVGSYISFIFVPLNKYYYVTLNQAVALVSFIILSIIGILIYKNIIVIVLALTLSGLCEMAFCNYLIKTKQLL
ncbi:MAG TPA: oligosaccharide flippase family protein [Paludibacter sp.]|nr:oligosaccharide flippase family protein [Paludibacter sp.]